MSVCQTKLINSSVHYFCSLGMERSAYRFEPTLSVEVDNSYDPVAQLVAPLGPTTAIWSIQSSLDVRMPLNQLP